MSWWNRLKNALQASGVEDELETEVDTHLAPLEAEEVKRGATPDQARNRDLFGSPTFPRIFAFPSVNCCAFPVSPSPPCCCRPWASE